MFLLTASKLQELTLQQNCMSTCVHFCIFVSEPIKDPFLRLLQQNLHNFKARLSCDQFHCLDTALKETPRELISDVLSTAVEWQFVSTILQLLHLLASLLPKAAATSSTEVDPDTAALAGKEKPKRPQDAPPLTRCALSVTHINTVRKALQFVACLGICPNLSSGVGIPLQHRSKLVTLAPLSVATLAETGVSSESRQARLSVCALVFAELLRVTELQSIVVGTHLNDLLAALLQLIYSDPVAGEKSKVSQAEETKNVASKTTPEGHGHVDQGKMAISTEKDEFESNALPKKVKKDFVGTEEVETCVSETAEHITDVKTRLFPLTDPRQLYRQTVETVLSVVSHDLLIRELMVLQAGVSMRVQVNILQCIMCW